MTGHQGEMLELITLGKSDTKILRENYCACKQCVSVKSSNDPVLARVILKKHLFKDL